MREHVIALPPVERILCIANGEGRNSVWLAWQAFEANAFDIADRAVARAQAFARREGVPANFALADVDGFSWTYAYRRWR